MIFGCAATSVGMSSYEEHEVGARYVRTNAVRLGTPGTWPEIIRQYKRNNPHLTLALLASKMDDETLDMVHDRQLEKKPIRL